VSSYVDALKRWRSQEQQQAIVTAVDTVPALAAAECDRLHERLQIVAGNESLRIVAFAGVSGGEGVGSIVLQYAEHLAQEPLNVLVVLADAHVLRSPTAAVTDLVKLVAENGSPAPSAERTPSVVGLPVRYVQAAQFLRSAAFGSWLASQGAVFDRIVMELPPALKYAEAASLAQQAGGVVLVVRAGSTQVADVRQAQRELIRAGARTLGVVLNHVQAPPKFLRRVLMPEMIQESGSRSESAS